MAQPGNNEGKDDEKDTSEYGTYQCVFRKADDSVYIMMKDKKSKRAFSNTFSKSTLAEMGLKQSVDEIVNLLESAKAGSDSALTFQIMFGDADKNKQMSVDILSNSFVKGYALYIIIAVKMSWFSPTYTLKLLEQKRSETDILHDIISDMQQEIDALKQKKVAVAKYRSTGNTKTNTTTWDVEEIAPSLNLMVAQTDSNKTMVIGMDGIYRITVRMNYTNTCSGGWNSYHYVQFKVNGNVMAQQHGAHYTCGFMSELFALKKNDKLQVVSVCGGSHSTNATLNCFIIEKIK